MVNIENRLIKEFGITKQQSENVIKLLDEGNTVPFIARYRKEVTGGLDDIILRNFTERLIYLRNLEERKTDVTRLIGEQEKLTEEIELSIKKSETLTEIDDIYRPFKPKKRTRATIAIEKGLKPLAEIIFSGELKSNIDVYAEKFISEEKKVDTTLDALKGAGDIISEMISDEADYRKWIRALVQNQGIVETKGGSDDTTPYEMYYEYKESVKSIPSHRILAINRGENSKILSVKIKIDNEKIVDYLKNKCLKGNNETDKYIEESIVDSVKRLIFPSIEREIRSQLTEKGEIGAIDIFKANLKALLMQSPIKGKVVLGFDPAFRTGCKIAVLDDTGKLLDTATVYATAGSKDTMEKSIDIIKELVIKHNVEVISLGNGTASRESEEIIARMIKDLKVECSKELYYVIVSEAGASVYSASELASKEYPDINVSIRGAISIGRRLQDPLVELVKIDPKAIGVGQYQHDIAPKKLDESLKGVVEDCVNAVGVDLNIATPSLLTYISGINAAIAQNIVAYREENGRFVARKELLKVKRLGAKAYEQCAGFLRVLESKEFLDNTSVHPETYVATKKLLDLLNYSKEDFKSLN
ncbi:MAG: RNA-binding transcriptional accessory protein, partial [Clostridium sp.]